MPINISLCFLHDYENLQTALISGLKISRSLIKKNALIKKKLKQKVLAQKVFEIPLDLVNSKKINCVYTGPDMSVLLENDNFIIIDKPAQVHCSPLLYSDTVNCLSYLRSQEKYAKKIRVNIEEMNRGLLNRLDFETSGILIFVKNFDLYKNMRENFHSFVNEKYYLAIVEGHFLGKKILENSLHSFGAKGSKIKVLDKKMASDDLATLEAVKLSYSVPHNYSLLKVKLITGKRHQIRAQLSHAGFPIVGDILYGAAAAERMFLHAYQYKINIADEGSLFTSTSAFFFRNFFDLDSILQNGH